jgi:hypothetical protein
MVPGSTSLVGRNTSVPRRGCNFRCRPGATPHACDVSAKRFNECVDVNARLVQHRTERASCELGMHRDDHGSPRSVAQLQVATSLADTFESEPSESLWDIIA